MTDYSFVTGIWKSIKNTVVVLAPAAAAGWLAFIANAPPEYQQALVCAGGFLAYLAKNYFQVKRE